MNSKTSLQKIKPSSSSERAGYLLTHSHSIDVQISGFMVVGALTHKYPITLALESITSFSTLECGLPKFQKEYNAEKNEEKFVDA